MGPRLRFKMNLQQKYSAYDQRGLKGIIASVGLKSEEQLIALIRREIDNRIQDEEKESPGKPVPDEYRFRPRLSWFVTFKALEGIHETIAKKKLESKGESSSCEDESSNSAGASSIAEEASEASKESSNSRSSESRRDNKNSREEELSRFASAPAQTDLLG